MPRPRFAHQVARWTRVRLAMLLAGLIVACGATAVVQPVALAAGHPGDAWLVLEAVGLSRYRVPSSDEWWPVRSNVVLPGGSRVVSDTGASMILSRGGDTIRMGPRSRVILPEAGASAVRQHAGDVRFRIQPRGASEPRFTVETPVAILVVKGTVFEVAVADTGAEVAVDEGLVAISSRLTGQSVDLQPGQRARHGADSAAGLEIQLAPQAAFQGAPAVPGGRARAAIAMAEAPGPAAGRTRRAAMAKANTIEKPEPPTGVLGRVGRFFRNALKQEQVTDARGRNNGVRDHGRGVGRGDGQGKGSGGNGGGGNGGSGGGGGGGGGGGANGR